MAKDSKKDIWGVISNSLYYLRCRMGYYTPNFIFRLKRKRLLRWYNSLPASEKEYIDERVAYYCKLNHESVDSDCLDRLSPLAAHTLKNIGKCPKDYFYDSYSVTRSFSKSLRWSFLYGNIVDVPRIPSIVKSRPIMQNNSYSVLLKLNKRKHFRFVKDKQPFKSKKDMALFRGYVHMMPGRVDLMEQFFGNPLIDCGDTSSYSPFPPEWKKAELSIPEHLKYKFILSLEGSDVASNLKWVMSSNSVAIMPQPSYETWFMEGKLIPGYHYIEVEADYCDLEEKINYYLAHPDEAETIAKNANKFTEQFTDSKRERLISYLVLERYFGVISYKL